MIREFEIGDIERVMEIWLGTNISAHSFINSNYWVSNYEMTKELMMQAKVYVYEEDDRIIGFIGMMENYISGIFIEKESQSNGIGKKLISYVKELNSSLFLNVYTKNEKAVKFYIRENFKITSQEFDNELEQEEYVMKWIK